MKKAKSNLSEKERELVDLLMQDCESTGDIQSKLKRLFAGTIEQMLEAEMEEHLGYEKNHFAGNNTGNSRNGYLEPEERGRCALKCANASIAHFSTVFVERSGAKIPKQKDDHKRLRRSRCYNRA